MTSPEYQRIERQLVAAGVPERVVGPAPAALEFDGPVTVLVNSGMSAAPYEDILIAALPTLHGMECDMVVRALSQKGMRRAGPIIAQMMSAMADAAEGTHLWAFGNAIAAINDPTTYDSVITLCRDGRLGIARQMLFSILPRIGTNTAYRCAVEALNDETVRGQAIEALGRFGRPEALGPLEATVTQPGLYEHRAKATAIRRLERKRK